MQIAHRFHLHQDLLEAIKKALNSVTPNTVPAEAVDTSSLTEDDKKDPFSSGETETFSAELPKAEKGRLERILFVRGYVAQGISMRRAAKELKMNRHTIRKYLNGDSNKLCRQQSDCNFRCEHSIAPHLDFITDCVNKGMFPSEMHRKLMENLYYQGSFHAFSTIGKETQNVVDGRSTPNMIQKVIRFMCQK